MVTLFIFPILMFWCCFVRAGWRFRRCHSTGSVWSMWSRSAVVSGMSGGTSMWWWPPVQCVMLIMISTWVLMTWCASVRGICDKIWSDFCVSCCSCGFNIHECDWDLDLLNPCLSLWRCLEVDLVQCLVWEWCFLWQASMPDGGILSGQSAATWPYSSQLKHHICGQWCAMCPNSWHWKHLSSSLVITFPVDEGRSVAVNCCAAWSLSTSLMGSTRFWGPFS